MAPFDYGDIVLRKHVCDALEETISAWQETYLAEIERQNDLDPRTLSTFKNFERNVNAVRQHIGSALPAVLIACPALAREPITRRSGVEKAYAVMLTVVAAGKDDAETEYLCDLYTSAMFKLLDDRRDLDGFASGIEIVDERYDQMPDERQENLGGGTLIMVVTVEQALERDKKPLTPADDPYDDDHEAWSTVSDQEGKRNVTIGTLD